MGCAQTGSGKTAAFLLPIISQMLNNGLEGSSFSEIQEPACLVVGPTRELVLQIRDEARKFSFDTMLRPCVVYGGTAVYHQLSNLSKGAHIVVGTPGRLMDFIGKGKVRAVKFGRGYFYWGTKIVSSKCYQVSKRIALCVLDWTVKAEVLGS